MTNHEIAKLIADRGMHMQNLAAHAIEAIRDQIAEAAEVVALKHMRDRGMEDPSSPEAIKIYATTERLFIASVMRHMANLNNFTDSPSVEASADIMREHTDGE
jgi:hypothetical protein